MGKTLVKSPLSGVKEQWIKEKKSTFTGISQDAGATFLNLFPDDSGTLRTHAPFKSAGISSLPGNIRAIRAYGSSLILLNYESGYYGIYVLKQGTVTKTGTTVSTYHYDSDGSEFCSQLILCDEQSAELDEGCTHTKLVFFPAKMYCCLGSDGVPSSYGYLPDAIPSFRFATLSKGRLYGIAGQKIYVSGEGGMLDWTFDEEDCEKPDSRHAWVGRTLTSTEAQLPITALVSYKNEVLIFRENAMQSVVGAENPYTVKDLFKVGTSYGKSVKEVDGKLYFISKNRVFCYNGSTVVKLPAPEKDVFLTGAAGVLDGKYCFYGEAGGKKKVYTYDADSKSYACVTVSKAVREFALCNDVLYALVGEKGEADALYCLSADRSAVCFEARFPLMSDRFLSASLYSTVLRATLHGACTMRVCAKACHGSGATNTYTLGTFSGGAGEVTYRLQKRLPSAEEWTLIVEGRGDMTFRGYECSCSAKIR